MINKIDDNTYQVGEYKVYKLDDKWVMSGDDIEDIYSTDLDTIILTANLRYYCGLMVSDSIRNYLKIKIQNHKEMKE